MANALRSSPSGCRWQQQCALTKPDCRAARAETSAAASKTTTLAAALGRMRNARGCMACSLAVPRASGRRKCPIASPTTCPAPTRAGAAPTTPCARRSSWRQTRPPSPTRRRAARKPAQPQTILSSTPPYTHIMEPSAPRVLPSTHPLKCAASRAAERIGCAAAGPIVVGA